MPIQTYNKIDYKFTAINIIFATSLIASNLLVTRVIETPLMLLGVPICINQATITYAITYLCTDIISESYGKKMAQKTVLNGFIALIIFNLYIFVGLKIPQTDINLNNSFNEIFGTSFIILIGSLLAYVVSQTYDVFIFHKIRGKFNAKQNKRWIWNNASTMTSQIIDTLIFAIVVWGFGFGMFKTHESFLLMCGLALTDYIIKFICAALDTPLFYLFTRRKKERKI